MTDDANRTAGHGGISDSLIEEAVSRLDMGARTALGYGAAASSPSGWGKASWESP